MKSLLEKIFLKKKPIILDIEEDSIFHVGDRVNCEIYGEGTVSYSGNLYHGDYCVDVEFDNGKLETYSHLGKIDDFAKPTLKKIK